MSSIPRAIINFAKDLGRTAARGIAGFTVFGLGTLYLDQNVAGFRRIEGPSMSPTLNVNEYTEAKFALGEGHVYGSKYSMNTPDIAFFTRRFELGRGDVVIIEDPKTKSGFLCKRVIALEGDQVVPLGLTGEKKEPVQLGEGEVWVESDAGFGYKDSNLFGPIRAQTVQAKVLWATKWGINTRRIKSEVPEESLPRVIVSQQ